MTNIAQEWLVLQIFNDANGPNPPPIDEVRVICANTQEPRVISEDTQETRIT